MPFPIIHRRSEWNSAHFPLSFRFCSSLHLSHILSLSTAVRIHSLLDLWISDTELRASAVPLRLHSYQLLFTRPFRPMVSSAIPRICHISVPFPRFFLLIFSPLFLSVSSFCFDFAILFSVAFRGFVVSWKSRRFAITEISFGRRRQACGVFGRLP